MVMARCWPFGRLWRRSSTPVHGGGSGCGVRRGRLRRGNRHAARGDLFVDRTPGDDTEQHLGGGGDGGELFGPGSGLIFVFVVFWFVCRAV